MHDHGADLRLPHSRAMGKGLFELRLQGAEGIGRAFYGKMVGREIVIFHECIKKTPQTREEELRIARNGLRPPICTIIAAVTLSIQLKSGTPNSKKLPKNREKSAGWNNCTLQAPEPSMRKTLLSYPRKSGDCRESVLLDHRQQTQSRATRLLDTTLPV